jgi:murein DD-endopeptidase MepM/ murein hydrolase activator NlpD
MLSTLWGGSALGYLNKFRKQGAKWSNGKAQLADPALILPSSNRRQYDAVSSTGLPCPPKAPEAVVTNPSETLARAVQAAAEEALMVVQEGGATGFKTDPADPDVVSGQRERSIRILRGDRFEIVSAIFPSATEAVDYVTPLADARISEGFGAQIGRSDKHTTGVEYDTSSAPNQTVHAVATGTVTKIAVTAARGNVVTINHDGYLVTEYGHLGEVLVSNGETVAPGDIIARAGQTLGRPVVTGAGQPVTGELVAVARARPDPVLFFAMRGDASLFDDGTMSSSLDFGTRPVPMDPYAVLRDAPAPGTVRSATRVETAMLKETRDGFAELAMTASTPTAQVDAENAYDMTSALSRADEIADMSRSAYTSQEDDQRQTRIAFGHTAVALNGSDF